MTADRISAKDARAAIDSVDFVRMKVDKPRMEGQQYTFLLLLAAAGDEGMNMQTAAKRLDVDHSFISRNTKTFGAQSMRDPIVFQRIDPVSPKFRIIGLTEHGHRLVYEAQRIAAGAMVFDRKSGTARKPKAGSK